MYNFVFELFWSQHDIGRFLDRVVWYPVTREEEVRDVKN